MVGAPHPPAKRGESIRRSAPASALAAAAHAHSFDAATSAIEAADAAGARRRIMRLPFSSNGTAFGDASGTTSGTAP